MSLPQSVREFIDEHQWNNSNFQVCYIPDSKEFMTKVLSAEYVVPVYLIRNWVVAHFTNLVMYTDLKGFTYDGVVSIDNEMKYVACGLFQEPVSLMHRYIRSGKTITLSFRYELENPDLLTQKNIKHKELSSPLKFLVEVTKRRCRIFVFLKRGRNGRTRNIRSGSQGTGSKGKSASTGSSRKAGS